MDVQHVYFCLALSLGGVVLRGKVIGRLTGEIHKKILYLLGQHQHTSLPPLSTWKFGQ
jgi:hypothetical protein